MAKDKPAPEAQDGEALPNALVAHDSTLTPDEWADTLEIEAWKHGAASALHRWAAHEHHAGAPKQLTRSDYEAAIAAALKPNPTPHAPALGTSGKA